MVSEQADLELGGKLALSGKDAEMKIEGALDVYAAQEVAMRTQSMDLASGGEFSAFAGGKASITTAGGMHVASGGDITVQGAGQQLELSDSQASLMTDGQVNLDA